MSFRFYLVYGILSLILLGSLSVDDSNNDNNNNDNKPSVSTDISECYEIEILGSKLHKQLSGKYIKSEEVFNDLPTFSSALQTENGDTRYIWWTPQTQFTRWSIGTERYSYSIEAFMDNKLNQAWMLGQGRHWHVVHESQWKIDEELYVICSRKHRPPQQQRNDGNNNDNDNDNDQTLTQPQISESVPNINTNANANTNNNNINTNTNANANGNPRTGGGAKPPQLRKNPPPKQIATETVIEARGGNTPIINQIYLVDKAFGIYDGYAVYKSRSNDPQLFLFHFSYAEYARWYLGYAVGVDNDVIAFVEDITHNLEQDATQQTWTEFILGVEAWQPNPGLKFTFSQRTVNNANTNTNQRRKPDPPIKQAQQQQQNQQQNEPNVEEIQQQKNAVQDQRTQEEIDDENRERAQKQSQSREERRRKMFRRVNKLDLEVQESGKYESGVDIADEKSLIISGSDDGELNGLYAVQTIRYNGKAVYKQSLTNSYLYYVPYADEASARWQIGGKNSGVQNSQPLAFVNSDTEYAYDIPTWQAWLVFDSATQTWMRQTRVNTYAAECRVRVEGAFRPELNGEYVPVPVTFDHRPVYERTAGPNTYTIFFEERETTYTRWYISQANVELGEATPFFAFIQSSALTVDGASDFESWQEFPRGSEVDTVENPQLKVTGNCSKVKEHDWKRRRKQRQAERKKRQALKQAGQDSCPKDMRIAADPGSRFAVVHWQMFGVGGSGSSDALDEDEFDVVYSDASVAPGSQFPLGRTSVVYTLKAKSGLHVAACDFVITVFDNEPPEIRCPGDIYIMTQYDSDRGVVQYVEPTAVDNSEMDIIVSKIGGPEIGDSLRIGNYVVSYQATDVFEQSSVCNFQLVVVDRQSPTITNCPKSVEITVYADTQWAAFPEWDMPSAVDAVDGVLRVKQIIGPQSGQQMTLPEGQAEYNVRITYEAMDESQNAARCAFTVKLQRGAGGTRHEVYHNKIRETETIGLSREEYNSHGQSTDENAGAQQQSQEWTDNAQRLRSEQQIRAAGIVQGRGRGQRSQRGSVGHHSRRHQQNVDAQNARHAEYEDNIREQTEVAAENANANAQSGPDASKTNNDGKTRAQRRKERREQRRREREEKRRNNPNYKDGGKKRGMIRRFFRGFVLVLWTLVRPWAWPWFMSIPVLLLLFGCCGYSVYRVYQELNDNRRRRRAPSYNSLIYQITSSLFNMKKSSHRI